MEGLWSSETNPGVGEEASSLGGEVPATVQSGVHVRHSALEVLLNFRTATVQGVSTTDVSFPIDFKSCTYRQAWGIFCMREDEELRGSKLPYPPPNRPNSMAELARMDSADVEKEFDVNSIPESQGLSNPPFCLAFSTPHPSFSTITSVSVNGSPSAFTVKPHLDPDSVIRPGAIPNQGGDRISVAEFDVQIPQYLGEQWNSDLLVAVPVRVLRLQLQRAFRAVGGGTYDPSREEMMVGNMAFTLCIAIEFELVNPTPANSVAYFASQTMRDVDTGKVKELPLFCTSQNVPIACGQNPWFPTIPLKIFTSTDYKGRFNYRVHWRLKVTVPSGFECAAPGSLLNREARPDSMETFTFETRGDTETLLPSQIAVFAGPLKHIDGEDSILYPFNSMRVGKPQEGTTVNPSMVGGSSPRDDAGAGWVDDFPEAAAGGGSLVGGSGVGGGSLVGGDSGVLDSPGRRSDSDEEATLKLTDTRFNFIIPESYEDKLRWNISHIPRALELLSKDLKDISVFRNINILFIPGYRNRGTNMLANRLTNKRSGMSCDQDEMSLETLLDGGLSLIPFESFEWLSNGYAVFGNLVVFDCRILTELGDFTESIRLNRLVLLEGILSLWIGNLLELPLSKLGDDYWFCVAIKKYYVFRIYEELFGRMDAQLFLTRVLQVYLKFVELGFDNLSLSGNKINLGLLSHQYPVFQIKSQLVLIALESQLLATSNGKYWLPHSFLRQSLSNFLLKLTVKYPKSAISSEKFLSKLVYRAKGIFIKNKLHINAAGGLVIPDSPSPSAADLDVHLYKGHMYYDISQWIEDFLQFQQAYIYGTGCPQVVISMMCEMQKKTGTLETLKVRIDQSPLQPPADVKHKEESSYYFPAIFSSLTALEHLLHNPDLIYMHEELAPNSAIANLKMQLTQSAQPQAFLEQLRFNLDSILYNPIELVARDNKNVIGFGYLGQNMTPICGGKGPLFNAVLRQASTSWASLTPEQRSIMASDTPAMESIVANLPNAVRVSAGASGGQPDWVAQLITWQCIRQTISIHDLIHTLCPFPSMNIHLLNNMNNWDKSIYYQLTHGLLASPATRPFTTELPESAGYTKFWPVMLQLAVYTENKITEESVSMRDMTTPSIIILKDSQPSLFSAKNRRYKRILGLATPSSTANEPYKFTGVLAQNADLDLLNLACTDNVKQLFSTSVPKTQQQLDIIDLQESTVAGATNPEFKSKSLTLKTIPILWTRIAEDSFVLAQVRRFQSLTMWIQQLLNDTCAVSQLEAILALSMCGGTTHVIQALRSTCYNSRMHPYNRGMAALALSHISRLDLITSQQALRILLSEIWELAKNPGVAVQNAASSSAWLPPLYSPPAMMFLEYVIQALTKCRAPGFQTPAEVYEILENCLTKLPSPVDMNLGTGGRDWCERRIDINHFIAEIVKFLPNLTLPMQPNPPASDPNKCGIDTIWNVDWVEEPILRLFDAVWSRFKLDRKFTYSNQSVTKAFLIAISESPTLCYLTRRKAALEEEPKGGLDFLKMFVPMMPILAEEHLPELRPWESSYVYLKKFVIKSNVAVENYHYSQHGDLNDSSWVETIKACSFASNCLNYINPSIASQGIKTTLSLILQGLLLPPEYILNATTSEILQGKKRKYNIEGGFDCRWIDDLAQQQYLMRSGIAVLAAVKLLSQLFILLPFGDMHEVVVSAWTDFEQVLENMTQLAPLALLPFSLTSVVSHIPVVNLLSSQSSSAPPNFSSKVTDLQKSSTPNKKHKRSSTKKPSKTQSVHQDVSEESAQQEIYSTAETARRSTLTSQRSDLRPSHSVDFGETNYVVAVSGAVSFGDDCSASGNDDSLLNMMMAQEGMMDDDSGMIGDSDLDLPGHDMIAQEKWDATEFNPPDNDHQAAMHSDDGSAAPAKTGHSNSGRKKRKSTTRKKVKFSGPEAVVLVPAVVETFDLLFGYLHSVAVASASLSGAHVFGVRCVLRFLFGDGIPTCVQNCQEFLGSFRNSLSQSPADLKKLDDYIGENYQCLVQPSVPNARRASKYVIRVLRAGLAMRQLPMYEKSFVNIWALSHKTQSWPLPLQMSWRSLALRLTQCLIEHPSAVWFIHPVDAQAMPSYYQVIENPMWLNKAIEQLRNRQYETFEQWKSDIFRIFRNCRIFNVPQTPVIAVSSGPFSKLIQDCDALQSLAYQLLYYAERLLAPYDPNAN